MKYDAHSATLRVKNIFSIKRKYAPELLSRIVQPSGPINCRFGPFGDKVRPPHKIFCLESFDTPIKTWVKTQAKRFGEILLKLNDSLMILVHIFLNFKKFQKVLKSSGQSSEGGKIEKFCRSSDRTSEVCVHFIFIYWFDITIWTW